MISSAVGQFLEFFSGKRENPVFLALGDSIISDCYPGPGYGVAALVQRGLEPVTRHGITRTGYRLPDLEAQLPHLQGSTRCRTGLLSIGGNDLLALDSPPDDFWYESFSRRYQELRRQLGVLYPSAPWLVCNLYDPTDGTGQLPGREARGFPPRPELVESLGRLNRVIAEVAGDDLVDIHAHCLGHGWSRRLPLWFQMDIEPNREGARQLADLLLHRLEARR
ncbi:MAG: SGNH/GDSL hydrolase family protein [Candidatus Eremiobacteraeota bacterium]|nr:SGNH/GDSL hydrolase family protein [Candidatus Eremiobacteraeota bacterium]MCW5872253.1 SGNH/GDSL hydrolase family protein [Candidatus Eremiobacteraeota bacterium]